MVKKIRENNQEVLKEKAARQLSALFAENSGPLLVLLAGGSSFSYLNSVELPFTLENFTFQLSDERFSPDPNINNFSQLAQTTFYRKALGIGATFVDTTVNEEDTTVESFGDRLDRSLRNWLEANPDGGVIATFGIGADGHACGMMPFPENPARFAELFEGKALIVGYDASGKNEFPLRATITASFVRKYVKSGIAYAAGQEKKAALERVLAEDRAWQGSSFLAEAPLAATPARIIRDVPDMTLFTDIQAK